MHFRSFAVIIVYVYRAEYDGYNVLTVNRFYCLTTITLVVTAVCIRLDINLPYIEFTAVTQRSFNASFRTHLYL